MIYEPPPFSPNMFNIDLGGFFFQALKDNSYFPLG